MRAVLLSLFPLQRFRAFIDPEDPGYDACLVDRIGIVSLLLLASNAFAVHKGMRM